MTWLRSTTALFVSALLLPPLGLILLWLRPARAWKKVAGSLAIGLVGVVHLVLVYGMRMELRGNGMTPVFTFRSKDRHFADLEQSRARQAKEAPAVAATAAPAPSPVLEAKTEAAPNVPVANETPAPSAYWTTFRGPNQDGVYSQGPIITEWPSSGLERLWKQPEGRIRMSSGGTRSSSWHTIFELEERCGLIPILRSFRNPWVVTGRVLLRHTTRDWSIRLARRASFVR
jgi:hypothetical protein